MKYDEAIFMLRITTQNPVLCFLNSLFTVSEHTNLINDLLEILKNNFAFKKFDIFNGKGIIIQGIRR
jgi:hypothetical protein